MASDITQAPRFRHTMQRLEGIKHLNSQGDDFWIAREIYSILGYADWDGFLPVIARAESSLTNNGIDPSHHIRHTTKLVEVGSGAKRRVAEAFLSRGACYLIAMNGDVSKPEIAGAQAYFAAQTRSAELAQNEISDRKRLSKRDKVTAAFKRVGDAAKDAGGQRYPLFHNARYRGLYDQNKKAVDRTKGLREGEDLFDRAGTLELSAHEFQMELAAAKIINEGISSEDQAIKANFGVAKGVRATMLNQGVELNSIPLEEEPIRILKSRLSPTRKLGREK